MSKPTVLVYRRNYLAYSETFIVDHIEGLRRWQPVVAYDNRWQELAAHGVVEAYTALHGRTPRKAVLHKYLGINPRLTAVMREHDVRLIHAHFLIDGAQIARFARRARVPLIVTAHGYDATVNDHEHAKDRDGRFLVRNRHALMDAATAIVCVSDFIRDELERRGYPSQKLVTQRLGIDRTRFVPGPPPAERRGVLYVGRLVEKKGCRYLLEAWERVPAALQAQGLTIIGKGPEEEGLRRLAEGQPHIAFLGAQPRDIVIDAMRRHRVFVFPSLRASNGDSEGLPIVGMEAQALGTPIVAFDDGPAREMLEADGSGLLVPRGDVDALAAAIVRVLSSDELANRLGARGPEVAAARFDGPTNVAALETLYDRVIASFKPIA